MVSSIGNTNGTMCNEATIRFLVLSVPVLVLHTIGWVLSRDAQFRTTVYFGSRCFRRIKVNQSMEIPLYYSPVDWSSCWYFSKLVYTRSVGWVGSYRNDRTDQSTIIYRSYYEFVAWFEDSYCHYCLECLLIDY